jgi:hypothetical protein
MAFRLGQTGGQSRSRAKRAASKAGVATVSVFLTVAFLLSDTPAAGRQSGWNAPLPLPCPKQVCCNSTTARRTPGQDCSDGDYPLGKLVREEAKGLRRRDVDNMSNPNGVNCIEITWAQESGVLRECATIF